MKDTLLHIKRIQELIVWFTTSLLERGLKHDDSKLHSPEVELFEKYSAELGQLKYNSPEYHESLAKLQPAIEHHYANNDHHPQHFKNGIDDMNLLQLTEMFLDWKASSERQNNGNILKSIEQNANRFNMSPQLVKIFENTAKLL